MHYDALVQAIPAQGFYDALRCLVSASKAFRFKNSTMQYDGIPVSRLTAYCRREWIKSPECHGLCSLCLTMRQKKMHIDCVMGAISQYLIHYELAVCVRSEFPSHESHFQVVDPRSKRIVATRILARPRSPHRRLFVDLAAVAEDLRGYAVIWHDDLQWRDYRMLEVFTLRRFPRDSFFCSKFPSTRDLEMSVSGLKFSSTDVTLLACSAAGEARLYRIDFSAECTILIWRRMDTFTNQLRFWGNTGHVAIAPFDSNYDTREIHRIHFETQMVSTLFKLGPAEPVFGFEGREVVSISAFASSPSNDVFLIALTSMQVLKFQVTEDTKFPVTYGDCLSCLELDNAPACIVAMDCSDRGLFLGDAYGLFYIVGGDCIVLMDMNGPVSWECNACPPVSEVFSRRFS